MAIPNASHKGLDKSAYGLVWFLLLAGSIWLAVVFSPGKKPHGHNPHPTPTPSPTPPSVTLAWDPAADQTDAAAGYYFKLGFASGQENQVTDVGKTLTRTVQLTSGQIYFFVVTAYDGNHNESLPSNEISYTPP